MKFEMIGSKSTPWEGVIEGVVFLPRCTSSGLPSEPLSHLEPWVLHIRAICDQDRDVLCEFLRSLQVAVVVTFGEMTKADRLYEKLSVVSADLKSKGVHVYAIGVGSRISRLELEEIASNSENVFTLPSFKDLNGFSSQLKAELCKGE